HIAGDYAWQIATANGAVEMPPPAGDLAITARLIDGTPLAVTANDDGSFAFEVPPGAEYAIDFKEVEDETPVEMQSGALEPHLRRRFFSRIDAVETTEPTT